MTFDDLHTRCILPQTWTVCGIALDVLRLGHVRVLQALGLTSPSTWAQLQSAIIVASQPVAALPAVLSMIRQNQRDKSIDRWLRKSKKELSLVEESKAFAAFYAYCTEPPEVVSKKEVCSPEPCVMPFVQHLRSVLLAHLNYDPVTIDDALYPQLLMDYYAHLEAEGMIRVLRLTSTERAELLREVNGAGEVHAEAN